MGFLYPTKTLYLHQQTHCLNPGTGFLKNIDPTSAATAFSQITDDIYQVRLPLPFALRIVNCYLVRDKNGWCIVDTGLHVPPARVVWRETFDSLKIAPGDVTKIVLTHCHPDHFGMAGFLLKWIEEASGKTPSIFVAPGEWKTAMRVFTPHPNLESTLRQYFIECGVPQDDSNPILRSLGVLRGATKPHPETVEHLQAGEKIEIGERVFQIIHTPGHSDNHLIFYDQSDQLVLCGDHVLQKITPNIGLWPASAPNPLEKYLTSLNALLKLEIRLALPGHGPIIRDWHGRIREILLHHDERLQTMKNAVDAGRRTPFEVCEKVFETEELTAHEIRFAIAESLSHLEYLRESGELKRRDGATMQYFPAN